MQRNLAPALVGTFLIGLCLTACDKKSQSGQSAAPAAAAAPFLTQAGPPSNPFSGMGFYPDSAKQVPEAVQKAADSVFLIFAPAGEQVTVQSLFGRHSITQIIAQVQNNANLSRGDKSVYLYQIKICAKATDPMNCKIYSEDSQSSCYLIGDGSRVRTAFHAVEDYAADKMDQSQKSQTASVKIPIFIYDTSAKNIWSPSMGDATAYFPKSNLADRSTFTNQITPPNDDLVEIQLPRSVGKPLQPAQNTAAVGDALYIIGYPQASHDRAPYAAPDSPGLQVRISIGKVISMNEAATREGMNPAALTDQSKSYYQNMILSNADGAPGLSGGATLNSQGQLMGTYTAGFPADGSASPSHISYSSLDSVAKK